jgi:GH24 family phage-related lysozyme (muramidase)
MSEDEVVSGGGGNWTLGTGATVKSALAAAAGTNEARSEDVFGKMAEGSEKEKTGRYKRPAKHGRMWPKIEGGGIVLCGLFLPWIIRKGKYH